MALEIISEIINKIKVENVINEGNYNFSLTDYDLTNTQSIIKKNSQQKRVQIKINLKVNKYKLNEHSKTKELNRSSKCNQRITKYILRYAI